MQNWQNDVQGSHKRKACLVFTIFWFMQQKDFNIAGPCNPGEHYMVNPLRNIKEEVMSLIERKYYFVIHAARQSGKTTLLKELARKVNGKGKYYALYCSLEKLQGIIEPKEAMPEIIDSIKMTLLNSNIPNIENFGKNINNIGFVSIVQSEISNLCKVLDKPLIILFDEADCLSNNTLISFLRQLRNGYIDRPDAPFAHTIALVGMRNIRDYKAQVRPNSETLGSASPRASLMPSASIALAASALPMATPSFL
jgi:hypothetical protein